MQSAPGGDRVFLGGATGSGGGHSVRRAGASELVRSQDTHCAFVGDHGVAREEVFFEPHQKFSCNGGRHDDIDLNVGKLLDVRHARAFRADAFDCVHGAAGGSSQP